MWLRCWCFRSAIMSRAVLCGGGGGHTGWSAAGRQPGTGRRGMAGEGRTSRRPEADVIMDPAAAGSRIPDNLSCKCNIGTMISSDPVVQFTSGSCGSLDIFVGRILDPIGFVMKIMIADL